MASKPILRSHIGLIVANCIWAVNYPFYKLLIPHFIDPTAVATLAIAFAGLLALGSFLFAPGEKIDRSDIFKIIGAAILWGIAKKLLLMMGMQYTSPIDASIIETLGPVLVLIISVLFMVDRFTPLKTVGMILGFAGTIVVVVSGDPHASAADKLEGNLLVLGAILASSFSLVWLRSMVLKYKPITVLRLIYPLAAVMILPFGLDPLLHTDFGLFTREAWWMLAYVTLMPTFGPNYLMVYSMHYVKPTISSIYYYIQPVIAAALSIWLGMDQLTWERGLAAVIVFAGVLLVVRSYGSVRKAAR